MHKNKRRKGPDWIAENRGYETPCHIWQHGHVTAGYGCVRRNGKVEPVHRAYWQETYGDLPPTTDVHHKCMVRDCVNLDHLEALPEGEHMREHFAKLDEEQVAAIRARYVPRVVTQRALASEYGVHVSCIKKILNGTTWR